MNSDQFDDIIDEMEKQTKLLERILEVSKKSAGAQITSAMVAAVAVNADRRTKEGTIDALRELADAVQKV